MNDDAAAALSDLTSVLTDFGHVIHACRWLCENLPPEEIVLERADSLMIRSMWESAVITYGRCFATGKGHLSGRSRTPVPKDILSELPADQRATHEAVMAERNQHVGHRANRQQQALVRVALLDPDEGRGVERVMTMLLHEVVRRDLPQPLLALCEHLVQRLRSRIDEARSEIAAYWNDQLDEAYRRATREPFTIELGGTGSVATAVFDGLL